MIRRIAILASIACCLVVSGCPYVSPPEQSVALFLPDRALRLDAISFTDVDPAEATEIWDMAVGTGGTVSYIIRIAGPRVDAGEGGAPIQPSSAFTPIGSISDRAVGQAGAELVEVATGEVVCKGTPHPNDRLYIGTWDWPKDVSVVIHYQCRDAEGNFTVLGQAQLQFGYVGAL